MANDRLIIVPPEFHDSFDDILVFVIPEHRTFVGAQEDVSRLFNRLNSEFDENGEDASAVYEKGYLIEAFEEMGYKEPEWIMARESW